MVRLFGVYVYIHSQPTSQEFVEKQTLRERIAEGISEEEAWRLFQQIVEALVHISNRGIVCRFCSHERAR